MKTIKKGLGILLIAVLLLNIVGTTAFAAVMPDRLMSIRTRVLESTINAGDTITLVVNIESSAAFPMWNCGEFDVGYDQNYFSIGSYAESIVTTGYGYEGMLSSYSYTDDPFATEPLPEEIAAYGWNNYMHLGLVDDHGGAMWVDASVDGGVDVFAVKIKVSDSIPDGVYYVGLGEMGYDNMTSFVNEKVWGMAFHGFSEGLTYGLSDPDTPLYDLSEAVVAITVGDAPTVPFVTNDGVKVQWDNDASHIKLGYKATISDLALTTTFNSATNAYEVNELSEVGVLYSTTKDNPSLEDVGSTAIKAICNTLYDNKDGTYSFRAVVKGAPIDSTTIIYSVMYITLTDGTTSYYSISGATTPKAAYDAGRLNGMPDFGV